MKLGQVALSVADLPRAVAFYRDVLGLPLLFEYPNLAFFDQGGVRLMLSGPGDSGEQPESVLYYKVDDLPATWKSLIEKSAKAEKEPHLIAKMPGHDLYMAFVRDADGRLVGIMSEVAN
jgi:catechol 2,3-dioxygenase-like lactoylglutathione lyase family enzyme